MRDERLTPSRLVVTRLSHPTVHNLIEKNIQVRWKTPLNTAKLYVFIIFKLNYNYYNIT